MERQLLLVAGLIFLSFCYLATIFFMRSKAKKRSAEQWNNQKLAVNDQIDPETGLWDEELYTEKKDRTYWYKLTFYFENDSLKEYDFYAYNGELTKEFILRDRFYVNEHELLIVDEEGEHYINRHTINRVDFLKRKLFTEKNNHQNQQEQSRKDTPVSQPHSVPASAEQSRPLTAKESAAGMNEQVMQSKKAKFYKVKRVKNPSVKKISVKKANYVLTGFVIFLLISGMLALIRTVNLTHQAEQLRREQAVLQDQFQTQASNGMTGYPHQLNQFMQTFIDEYIPLSNDAAAMETRVQTLKAYFTEDVLLEKEISAVKRTLIASELIAVDEQAEYSTAKYRIDYSLEIPVERTKGLEEGTTEEPYIEYRTEAKTTILHLDYIKKENAFVIISYPYFGEFQLEFLTGEKLDNQEEALAAVTAGQLTEIRSFLEIFFEKYANGTKEELAYLMDSVESLGGDHQIKEFLSLEAYQHQKDIHAYTIVVFEEQDSGITHKQAFSLKLSNNNGQFKINKLRHHLGGFD